MADMFLCERFFTEAIEGIFINNIYILLTLYKCLEWYELALGIFRFRRYRFRAGPFHILLLCCLAGGLAGGLLDLDHIPRIFGWDPPVLFEYGVPPNFYKGRFLHGIALVVGGIGCACTGGYLYWLVLKEIAGKVRARLLKKYEAKNG